MKYDFKKNEKIVKMHQKNGISFTLAAKEGF